MSKMSKNVKQLLVEYLTQLDVEDVYATSRLAHLGQKRRTGEDYFTHPQGVAKLIRKFYPKDTRAYLVALLHDSMEDTEQVGNISQKDLRSMISASFSDQEEYDQIIAAVQAVTHEKNQPYDEYVLALSANPLALRVKLADILHNLSTSPSERQKEKYSNALNLVTQNFTKSLPGINTQHMQALKKALNGLNEGRVILREGPDDPGIFKAIFLAGGPGSGKSSVVKKIVSPNAFGLKLVNVDTAFEKYLKDAEKNTTGGLDLSSGTSEEKSARMKMFNKARALTKKRQLNYIDGRLGIVIDGTGGSFNMLRKSKERLEALGYDTYMIYVDTSLEVALDRNIKRGEAGGRRLRDKDVERSWGAVSKNKEPYTELFGENISVIDGDRFDENQLSREEKKVRAFIQSPPRDQTALSWIVDQRQKKTENQMPESKIINALTLRDYVRQILNESVEFREVESPLEYARAGNVKRIALCDSSVTDPPGKHDSYFAEIERWRKYSKGGKRLKKPRLDEIIPGVSDVCIIGFLDYHQKAKLEGGTTFWYIDYMKTREDMRGQGLARQLVEKFYETVPQAGDYVNFGKMMQPQVGHLKDEMAEKYPEIDTKGAKYF